MPPTYFAIGWPIWAEEPECRPGSTSIWHVGQIQDEESVSVCVITDEPDRWSSWPAIRPHIRCIYTYRNAVLVRSCIAVRDSNRFVHVSGTLSKASARHRMNRTHCTWPYVGSYDCMILVPNSTIVVPATYVVEVELAEEHARLVVINQFVCP